MELEPRPVLRIHLNDISHSGTSSFLSLVDASRLLSNATNHVLRLLYEPCAGSKVPPTRSVTLILRPMDGVAYTTGLQLDALHKEIHFSVEWIQKYSSEPERCRAEIIGVVTHEIVHCYQYNALGTAPSGLIEGIADYVRLKAGLAPPHWQGPKKELGEKWDSGYQKTAYFLNWLEQGYGEGTVGRINESMRTSKYDETRFWEGIFGSNHGIDVLWKEYRDSLERCEEHGFQEAKDSDGEEAVLVEREDAN